MKRIIFWLFIIFNFPVYLCATTIDSISTSYKNGEFITYSQVWVKVPKEVLAGVIEDFVFQTKYDLDALFTWALTGMNLRNEKNEFIVFNFISTEYNDKTGLIRGTGDVVVPYLITFPNIHIDSKLDHIVLNSGKNKVTIDVFYSDAFLKKTIGVFYLIPHETGCWITLETRVKFGWFFDIFITRYRFSSIMEWRFQRMMHNIKKEAERRESIKRAG
ncbi:MAG: hypothetical protein Q7U47_12095 [Paludibacter sp.]|nr:hypothetical protein [Paludibacter sp.]